MYGNGIASYFVYGMHYCFNAVTETDGYPGAVLVRASTARLPAWSPRRINIDRSCNSLDLTDSPLQSEAGQRVPRYECKFGAGWRAYAASGTPWRFWNRGAAFSGRRVLASDRCSRSMLG